MTKNVSMMWADYAKKLGVGVQSLTKAQKIQAEVNGIMEETRFQMGDAAKAVNTYAGQMAMLYFNFTQLKVSVGNAIMPIVQAVLPGINSIISALTTLANVFAQVTSLLFGGGGMKEQENTQTGIASSAGAAAGATDDLASATGGMGDASKKAAKDMKGVTAGFDDLNVLASSAADSLDSAAGAVGGLGAPDFGGGDMGQMWGDVEINPEIAAFVERLREAFARLNEALGPTKEALAALWEQLKIVGGFAWDGLKLFYNNFLRPVGEWVLGEGLPRFIAAITEGLATVDWKKINDALDTLWKALAPFAMNIGEGLLWLWENALVPLGTWTMNEVVPRFLRILAGAIDVLNAIIEIAKPALEWLWDTFLKPIAEFTGGMILSLLDEIHGWIELIAGILTGDFDRAVAGAREIVQSWGERFTLVKDLVIAAWSGIKETLGAVASWFDENIIQPVSTFFSNLWSNISTWASEAWDSIVSVFKDAAEWFDKHLIKPITTGFKGFVNGLIGYVEGFINFFVRGINKIIDAVNSLSFDIPDILGGGTIGFNLPNVSEIKLPRLANGAVIPPNQQFAAILGDQRSGVNIETPLSTMVQAFKTALNEGGYAGGDITVTMPVYLDNKEIYRGQKTISRQIGKNLVGGLA